MDIVGADQFNDLISTSGKLVIVDFWAEWCGPCRMIAPVLESMEAKYADKVQLVKIDVDSQDNYPLASKYEVNSIPRVLFFKNGVKVDDFVGVVPPVRIEELISQHTADMNGTTDMPMAA